MMNSTLSQIEKICKTANTNPFNNEMKQQIYDLIDYANIEEIIIGPVNKLSSDDEDMIEFGLMAKLDNSGLVVKWSITSDRIPELYRLEICYDSGVYSIYYSENDYHVKQVC